MPSTIEQAKEAVLKYGGKASKHQIARELKISLDYAGLVLGELRRKKEIVFSDGFYVLTSSKKDVSQDKEQEKQVASPKRPKKTKRAPKESKLPTRLARASAKRAGQAKKSKASKHAPHPLVSILEISESLARTLEKAGYATIESIAEARINKLMIDAKLKLSAAARLINQARKIK